MRPRLAGGRGGVAVLAGLLAVAGSVGGSSASTVASRVRRPGVVAPPVGARLQYELQTGPGDRSARTGGIDTTICAPPVGGGRCVRPTVFDIDLYGPNGTTPNAVAVAAIRARGGYPICYVDAGTWESWRPDAARYPRALLGRSNGWPGERWLDIARTHALLPILAARVARCRGAGFLGVEFDNVDGYANPTGFALSAGEQLAFDRDLAALAHRDGLAAGLKNDFGQVRALEPSFDFALDESCVRFGPCSALAPFVAAHKAVFDVEYATGNRAAFAHACAVAARSGIPAIGKRLALFGTPWTPCR